MTSRITAHTRVIALLGDPVSHSLSPVIQNAAFGCAGVDGVYVALRCPPESLSGFMRGLAMAGGGGNVTLPLKEKAATVLDSASEAVRRTGACNTFWGVDGEVHGDNTDVEGFRRALREFLGGSPEGQRVLLLGAGGAARATLVALLDEDVREVVMLNRTLERARAISRRIGGARARVATGVEELSQEDFDLVVNATRLGLEPDDPLPLDLGIPGRVGAVMDLVYGERPTPFVREARERGIAAQDGGLMLVHQGAVAFERWWKSDPPMDEMREAVRLA